jgi:signal transduction histidine kinase
VTGDNNQRPAVAPAEVLLEERTRQLAAANEALRTANRAKSAFLANVSHELRTPLTAILGFSEILVAGEDGALNPRQHEDATTILANSRRLLELIDDLIDISQIEADRLELDAGRVAIGGVLGGIVDEMRPLAGAKGIQLTLRLANADPVVEADPERLAEIVRHLVSNAIKFTRPDGTVDVVTALDEDDAAGSPVGVRIDVVDSGIGIAPEDQERVFEKFHRVAGPEYPGTGLGLAIARELARLHGGSLTVASTLGLGSRFTVRLPLAREASRV